MKSSNGIRNQFIQFFKDKGHEVVRSAPIVPINDPTLLFTNAGMNQFKDIFLGKGTREYSRAVNSQKCLRAGGKHNDLEEVGKDDFHHTFFEMLGNWSFGDYYKKEAIKWAWELITEIWQIPKEKLFATVHYDDAEAFELWQTETDISPENILKFGDKDNFWEMGDTGPCGPCSEIHYDRGVEHCSKIMENNHVCEVNGDCGRFVEIWNLVFIQYNRLGDGELINLPQKHVDTGAGFERLVAIIQNKYSNYETDLFMPILRKIEELSGMKYDDNPRAFRVIADHIRALSFSIADGVLPSNIGRGYVIRRILRRAFRYGRLLNFKQPFLYKLFDVVLEVMGKHFRELQEKQDHIKMTIQAEEKRFNITLDTGIEKFNEIVSGLEVGSIISAKDAFKLYDTYGFPLDLTRIMAEERNLNVNEKGFEIEMEQQKERTRESSKFDMGTEKIKNLGIQNKAKTKFVGYSADKIVTQINHFFKDEENNVIIVLEETPFYAESGGQIADTGKIYNDNYEFYIQDVQKENGVYYHFGKLVFGEFQENNEEVVAEVDLEKRKDISRNHTATHLLHAALRKVLGKHLHQKGSYVSADRVRFDFTHFQPVTKEELDEVEEIVCQKILKNIKINSYYDDLENARKKGAMALFGEKYDKEVRVIEIGKFSLELCGGLHCNSTGDIGFVKIISESSIASGVRRIEAVSGKGAYKQIKSTEEVLENILIALNSSSEDAVKKIQNIESENKKMQKELAKFELQNINKTLDRLIKNAKKIDGFKVVAGRISANDSGQMRDSADQIKRKIRSGIGILFSVINGKVSIICTVTDDLKNKYPAGKIVREVAKIVDGKGGGKPDMAMGGGKHVDKIDEAIKMVSKIILNIETS
ncbi:MAG: alanine--tRNA ligase [Candidatus Cloacimonadota bacterium]|nr:alanine--tRNA ligase [Candidatus Cloacimonadota bacterium]